jgi:rod shape-determining protein MreB
VIALGGIVCNQSIRIAGDGFTADIQAYMRHQHNIKIGERTAEEVKIQVGSALPDSTILRPIQCGRTLP